MGTDEITKKVRDIIVEQLGVNPEQVTPQAKLVEDLGMDSLDSVELAMSIEEEFGIDIDDDDADKFSSGTVSTIIEYLESVGV